MNFKLKQKLTAVVGTPDEGRSDEFYRENRWMGRTAAEARWDRSKQVVVTMALVLLVGAVYYWA